MFDVSELFRCYFDFFSIFFRCFFSVFSLSMFCLFCVFAFLCFIVLCFVIDPYERPNYFLSAGFLPLQSSVRFLLEVITCSTINKISRAHSLSLLPSRHHYTLTETLVGQDVKLHPSFKSCPLKNLLHTRVTGLECVLSAVLPYFFGYKMEFFSFQHNLKNLESSYKI